MCFGASGSVRARQTPPLRLVRRGRPHLLSGQLPAAVDPHRLGTQRRQVRAGFRLGKQLAPEDFAAQGGRHETLHLLRRAVLEDGRRRPPADHQVRPQHTRRRHLLIDQQLLGRPGAAAVRRRPVRRQQPRFGQRRLALVLGQRGDTGDRFGDLGSQVGDLAQVDAQATAHAGLGQLGSPAQPACRPAEELPDPVGPTQVQVRVVLPGDADAAEHLNAVLDVGLGRLDPDARGDGRGNGQLAVIVVAGGAGGIGGGHRHLLGAAQHLGAQVLDRLEAADRLAELLAHLGIGDGGIQRPTGDSRRFGGQHGRGQVVHPVRGLRPAPWPAPTPAPPGPMAGRSRWHAAVRRPQCQLRRRRLDR